MENRKSKGVHIFQNHLFLWKLCFHTAPGFMIYWIYDGIRLKFFVFLEHTIGIRFVLECAEFGKPFSHVVIFMCGLIGLLFLQIFFDGYFQHSMIHRYKPKLYKALKEQMYEKAAVLDLACYDNPDYYNEFVLAVAEAENSIDRFLSVLNSLSASLTVIITTGTFFFLTDAAGVIFVAISFILTFLFSGLLNRLNFKIRKEMNPYERKCKYIERVCYLNDYAKELRLNKDVAALLEEDFAKTSEKMYLIGKSYAGKRCLFGFLRNYLSGDFITDGLYIGYLVIQAAVLRTISYSNAVVLFNSAGNLRGGLRQFAEVFPSAAENSLYIDKIHEFMAMEPTIEKQDGKNVPDEKEEIQFKHVTFSYTKNGENTLNDINFIIHPGEKIALVGYNGAGKTTLIKLLMRLYDPVSGEILYGKTDIREYDVHSYRRKMGVVFQDYKMYGATLKENVVLDDLEQVYAPDEKVLQSLKSSGFYERFDTLQGGLETPITAEFDEKGVNLSGGESQKVAIARVFYQDADLMIMDEPSSALDPIAEYNLNKAMELVSKDKTVIYISHRLSTTRDADRILMLEKGRIIEEGTHEQLLNRNGSYARMWNAQAGRYR